MLYMLISRCVSRLHSTYRALIIIAYEAYTERAQSCTCQGGCESMSGVLWTR